jgi:tetratricopeptide (TPR) repeat protein
VNDTGGVATFVHQEIVMTRPLFRVLITLVLLSFALPGDVVAREAEPLRASEVMALVAGEALSDNVAHELRTRGIRFHPDDAFRAELKVAGADDAVISALNSAKFVPGEADSAKSADELVKRLSNAGGFLRGKKFDAAIGELDAALAGGYPGPETAFVMGAILVQRGDLQEAEPVYEEMLRKYPNFPELHTKLSYVFYRLGDGNDGYKEAQIALHETPENAEARKNSGLNLDALGNHDAAITEYREALKLKQNYTAIWFDLGISQIAKGSHQEAVDSLKRAIALDPNEYEAHYNLGCEYMTTHQLELAVAEFRLAKKIDPSRYEARHNLAVSLLELHDTPAATAEFRQLETSFPDAEICHLCLAKTMRESGDLPGALAEYHRAASIDPHDPAPHRGVSYVLEAKKDYDGALQELQIALRLEPDSPETHHDIARVLLNAKRVKEALPEIALATQLEPSDWYNHGLYASVLEANGQIPAALAEYKQAVTLNPSQYPVIIEYAELLEKSGDWPGALEQFRKAAIADTMSVDTQKRYTAEQERFEEYLASLKSSGRSAEADALRARVAGARTSMNLSEQMDDAMQRGAQAFAARNQADALLAYKQAVELGEKMQPHDPRLLLAFQRYGLLQIGLKNSAGAQAIFERALVVTAEVYGPDSPHRSDPLGGLAANAMQTGDFESASKYYAQIMELNRKTFGEQSGEFASSLVAVAMPYVIQRQWEKAEPILLRSERIVEANVSATDDYHLWTVTSMLCQLYDGWGKPEQLLNWDRRLLAIQTKMLGENSPKLSDVLSSEAKALTALGRTKEAAEVDQRLKALQAGAGQPGSNQ